MVQRVCKCGCNRLFTPPTTRPGQAYLFGHKPTAAAHRPGSGTARAASKSDAERRVLDYRMALSAAERERAAVESDIDARDDEIAELRGKLHGLEAAKEKLVDRHLVISASIEALGALATGKSVRDLIEPAAKDAA